MFLFYLLIINLILTTTIVSKHKAKNIEINTMSIFQRGLNHFSFYELNST